MPSTIGLQTQSQIDSIRRFNRFYTRVIGTLEEGFLHTQFTLPEARVLYEIAQRRQITPSEIAATLMLDLGYVSRILGNLADRRLITRKPSPIDGRQSLLSVTRSGEKAAEDLSCRADEQVHEMIAPFTSDERKRLVDSMNTVESLLADARSHLSQPWILRPHRPGDMGWVVERHSVLYSQEYGWGERFEAFVARITADFIDHFDPAREQCWIADRDGDRLGCVFLVKDTEAPDDSTARLRLLLVEPPARGLGLGRALVQQCTTFARRVGYRRITLWTNSVLDTARQIYQREGYRLISEKPHHSFGKDLVGQNWELDL
ncbi:MAG TPA: bifunctional helix-turn-helix transcriptional regulator/GNAT family N-acetyltransferase [Edaphobacter sp.]